MKLEDEYRQPFEAWTADPSPTNADGLLQAVRPVLDSGLRQFAGNRPSAAAKARAKRLALDAFGSYDPNKGRLRTHLMQNLQRLRRSTGAESRIISTPERVALDRKLTDEAGRELEDRLGRPPSDRELADFTGLSTKRLEHLRRAKRPVAEGAIEQPKGDGVDPYAPAVRPLGRDPVEQEAETVVHGELNPVDQFVMENLLGMHGRDPLSTTEIARQLRVSPSAVTQRAQRIQARIDRVAGLLR